MASIEDVFARHFNLYTTDYDYGKEQGIDGVKPRSYDGNVLVPAGLTQQNGKTYALIHAADVQIGKVGTERLSDKLSSIDSILRDIYGESPTTLSGYNLESLADIAAALNNSDTTVNDRITALRMWKTIAISEQSSAVTDLTANTTSIIADNNNDTITIESANKWIKFAGIDSTTNKLQVGHLVGTISTSTATNDLNNNGTFAMPVVTYDEAGHITNVTTTTYTLPYNWKSISTVNNTSSHANDDLTGVDATINALTNVDTVEFVAANQWIKLAAVTTTTTQGQTTTNTHQVKLAHSKSALAGGTYNSNSSWTSSNQIKQFGESFSVLVPSLSFTTDDAGHITAESYGSSTVSLTLPTIIINDTTTGQIITGITKTETTTVDTNNNNTITAYHNTFTIARANVGTFAITGYVTSIVPQGQVEAQAITGNLAAADSLNTALAKLENRCVAIENNISNNYLSKNDASSTYLTQTDANTTYLSKTDASTTYLSKTDAGTTYLTKTDAGTTYLTKTDAGTTYLSKTDAGTTYLSKSDASTTYLSQADAATTYQAIEDVSDPYAVISDIGSAVDAAVADLLSNYTMVLIPVTIAVDDITDHVVTPDVSEFKGSGSIWLEKIEGASTTTVSGSVQNIANGQEIGNLNTYTIIENGTYRLAASRTYQSQTAETGYSEEFIINDIEPESQEEPEEP